MITIAVLRVKFDSSLDKGQYKNDEKLKNRIIIIIIIIIN